MQISINLKNHMTIATQTVKHFSFLPGLGANKKQFVGICNSDCTIDQLKISISIRKYNDNNDNKELQEYLWQIRNKVSLWLLTKSPQAIIQQEAIAENLRNSEKGINYIIILIIIIII